MVHYWWFVLMIHHWWVNILMSHHWWFCCLVISDSFIIWWVIIIDGFVLTGGEAGHDAGSDLWSATRGRPVYPANTNRLPELSAEVSTHTYTHAQTALQTYLGWGKSLYSWIIEQLYQWLTAFFSFFRGWCFSGTRSRSLTQLIYSHSYAKPARLSCL